MLTQSKVALMNFFFISRVGGRKIGLHCLGFIQQFSLA
jgi:hypothetical protein